MKAIWSPSEAWWLVRDSEQRASNLGGYDVRVGVSWGYDGKNARLWYGWILEFGYLARGQNDRWIRRGLLRRYPRNTVQPSQ
jgi:hypothetical protein